MLTNYPETLNYQSYITYFMPFIKTTTLYLTMSKNITNFLVVKRICTFDNEASILIKLTFTVAAVMLFYILLAFFTKTSLIHY